jgi:hypothetical protein
LQQSCIPLALINLISWRKFAIIRFMRKKLFLYLVFFGVLLGSFYAVMVYTTDFEKVKLPVLNTVQPFSVHAPG